MQLFVKIKVFDSIVRDEDVMAARQAFSRAWHKLLDSGKVVSSGVFADSRGGYMVVDVDKAEEFWSLPGPGILDYVSMETHPVTPADRFLQMFQQLTDDTVG